MISVVIPAYNEEKYISNCLDSIVRQESAQNLEVIVVDNNSTDNTLKVIQKFRDKLNHKNVVAVTGPCKFEDCSLLIKIIMNQFQPFGMVLYRVLFGYYWLSGFNFAIKKSAYLKSGGFNPELNTFDDIELGEKIKRFGKVVFIRNTPVIVSGRRFKKGLFEGLSSYFKPFIEYSLFHKKSVSLDDPR